MSVAINWLHITDLHLGLDSKEWLWPQMQHKIIQDIKKQAAILGAWDIIFFTGDLTQCGEKEEFEKFELTFQEFLEEISENAAKPKLCIVPGNHDLVRPDENTLISKAIQRLWWSEDNVRNIFWNNKDCEYRKNINEFFKNFSDWKEKTKLPLLESNKGILSGDFSATFEKENVKLGIIGLNTAFLHIADGECDKKLDLHISQLSEVCKKDPVSWLKEKDIALLMTHHPPSCLETSTREDFRQEINPSGRFCTHLCGHLHEARDESTSLAGSPKRRITQAASLFGLKKWGSLKAKDRIHGYSAGQYIFEENSIDFIYRPRKAIKRQSDDFVLDKDQTFNLKNDGSISEKISTSIEQDKTTQTNEAGIGDKDVIDTSRINNQNILDTDVTEEQALKTLSSSPRLNLSVGFQHSNVRLEEQESFRELLKKDHMAWLSGDWGTGRNEFIAASLSPIFTNEDEPICIQISCDDIRDIVEFEDIFRKLCGIPFPTFCLTLAKCSSSVLVLDSINPSLLDKHHSKSFLITVKTILDYCPNLLLILTSRLVSDIASIPCQTIKPLDLPDTRTFLLNHPESTQQLRDPEVIDKLHELSDGLPLHLDRMVKTLKVSSFASLLEAEMEGPGTGAIIQTETPKALIHAVSSLSNSPDKYARRSFLLLQVLSVLPYGETLESLHYFFRKEPFFPQNAQQLQELALLDVIPLNEYVPAITVKDGLPIRQAAPVSILKVPRHVRDYVLSLMSDDERFEITKLGLDLFFGKKWNAGTVKLRNPPPECEQYFSSGPGNEFALLHHMLMYFRRNGETEKNKRIIIIQLGIKYANHLNSQDRYRDLLAVTSSIIEQVDLSEHSSEWSQLAILAGKSSRMMGNPSEAIKYLREALEVGKDDLTKDQSANVYLNIALAEEKTNIPAAIEAANQGKELSKPRSSEELFFRWIIARQELNKT